ncbi:MAG TPA: hypothetical protein PKX28_02360, partial [Candidatus Hydrogenedentes bacterium]|nr:hypothetical protein [Candidatus Hydrogenedentota bacterium]
TDDMLEGILCRLDLLQSQLAALTRLAHGGAGATGLGLQTGDQAADFACGLQRVSPENQFCENARNRGFLRRRADG